MEYQSADNIIQETLQSLQSWMLTVNGISMCRQLSFKKHWRMCTFVCVQCWIWFKYKRNIKVQATYRVAVNMDWKNAGCSTLFRWLSLDIYHINILKNPNEVDAHWQKSRNRRILQYILFLIAWWCYHLCFCRDFSNKMSPFSENYCHFHRFLMYLFDQTQLFNS